MAKDETDRVPDRQEERPGSTFGEGEDGRPMSIAAARRSRAARMGAYEAGAKTADASQTSLERFGRDVETIKSAVLQSRKVDMPAELSERLERLEKRLNGIGESVAFTEAYVSVEMEKRIQQLIREELAGFHGNARGGSSRAWIWLSGAVLLLLMAGLGAEIYNDSLSRLLASAIELVTFRT